MSGAGPARALPASPNLEQQQQQARELLRAVKAGDAGALERMRARHPRFAGRQESFALSDAQLVIAREYGFRSWPALKVCIDGLMRPGSTRPYVANVSWYDERAHGLVEMHRGSMPTALAQIRAWHPTFTGRTDADIAASPFGLDDARLVYARQHGAATWDALMTRVSALGTRTSDGNADAFARAFAAIEGGDAVALRAIVDHHRSVLIDRGSNGNTLLNLATAIGRDDSTLVGLLIDAGADPNVPNDRGWTPLHAAAAGNKPALVARLIGAGAVVTIAAHGDGGTPLAVALWWANGGVAEQLAAIAIVPDNLRVNAALGRRDRAAALARFFNEDGSVTRQATSGRGFYRPHSGFPAWTPSDSRQELLDEALAWTARNNSIHAIDTIDVMATLVAHGANVNGVAYRGTPLMFAVFFRQLAAARWLLEHGADANGFATFHGRDPGRVTALHLAAQTDEPALVELLLAHGADGAMRDETYHADAAGWARYVGASHTLKLLE